jgi:glycerol-3-phosphate dehydrogenase
MTRDLTSLTERRFDVLVIGGGIHGLAAVYDAAQRGLSAALVERGDFGGGISFNHAKTIHGGLRSLQTGDVVKARFSMGERRAFGRIAPNYVVPLGFMMATTHKLMRSTWALRAGFLLDATIGFDRNEGVVKRLHLPAGRVTGVDRYLEVFGTNASETATGGAHWYDYHVPESDRITLAFAKAAAERGAVLANYVEALEPITRGGVTAGVRARDVETGTLIEIESRIVVNATGSATRDWIDKLGGHLDYPLIKATNVVTRRSAGPYAISAQTNTGRLLLIMPWKGRALIGTSHSESPVDPGDNGVSAAELGAFIAEINTAFPGLSLAAPDVTLVHRGVVPAERGRNGMLGLMGHHMVYDHAKHGRAGAISVVGVKYTAGRGVAQQVIDRVMPLLGLPLVPGQTGTTLLPTAFEHAPEEETLVAEREAGDLLPLHALGTLVRTHGTAWRNVLAICRTEPGMAQFVAGSDAVPRAVVAHAVRAEWARTLADVVVRRTSLGSAGYPGDQVVRDCAAVMAAECGWDDARVAREIEALRAFYAPLAC